MFVNMLTFKKYQHLRVINVCNVVDNKRIKIQLKYLQKRGSRIYNGRPQ